MFDVVYYLLIVAGLAVATIGGAFVVRSYLSGVGPRQAMGGLFSPKPERRLSISEQFNIDSRRRLVLVRRDNVEHLIMTGGPVDIVIEAGIGGPQDRAAASPADDGAPTPAPQRGSIRA